MIYEFLRDTSRWSLIDALRWQAETTPDAPFLNVVGEDEISFKEIFHRAERVATFFDTMGVKKGDHVVLFLQNGEDYVLSWFGLARLGAVPVLLNTELTGNFLEHQLKDSGAKLVVVDRQRLTAIEALAPGVGHLENVLIVENSEQPAPENSCIPVAEFCGWHDCDRWNGSLPNPSDIGSIMYTSGTTGPSKGVLMPHAHCFLFGLGALDNLELSSSDRYYITLPLYHANGLLMQLGACLIAGACAILRRIFSASSWLDDVRNYRVTVTNTLGVTAPFIFAQPESPADLDHDLRMVMAAPNPHSLAEIWQNRYGVKEVVSGYGMTECNMPIWGRSGVEQPPDSAGYVYDRYFEVKIVDPDSDLDRPTGEVGEIVIRPRAPFGFMVGYHGLPDRTVEAWRNLWFHTGDAGVMDSDGVLTFVDRIRDCIRRRGHNISSFEVEKAFLSMDGVTEVAAFAVPASFVGGEDEIMLSVVTAAANELPPDVIAQYGDALLPKFALPRYIETAEFLPKTPTGKIQKEKLRKRGISDKTWDREAQKN